MKTFATLTALSLILSLPLEAIGDDDDNKNLPAARAKLLDKPPTYDDDYVPHRRPDTHSLAQDLVYVMTGWKVHEFESLSGEVLGCALKHAPLIFPAEDRRSEASFESFKPLVGLSVEQIEAVSEMRNFYFDKKIDNDSRGKIIADLKPKTPEHIRFYGNAIQAILKDFGITIRSWNMDDFIKTLLSIKADGLLDVLKVIKEHQNSFFSKDIEPEDRLEVLTPLLSKTPDELTGLTTLMTTPPFDFERPEEKYSNEARMRAALYKKTPQELKDFIGLCQGKASFLLTDPRFNSTALTTLAKYPAGELRPFVSLVTTASKLVEDKGFCTLCNLSYVPFADGQRIVQEVESELKGKTNIRSYYDKQKLLEEKVEKVKEAIKAQEKQKAIEAQEEKTIEAQEKQKALEAQKEKAKPASGATISGLSTPGATTSGATSSGARTSGE